jgi:hypothetical protein
MNEEIKNAVKAEPALFKVLVFIHIQTNADH